MRSWRWSIAIIKQRKGGTLKRILVIFGTRPEAIKLAPVIKALQRRSGHFRVHVCVTGQHREMLDQVLGFFDITPDFDLRVMKPDQTLNELSARLFVGLDDVIRNVGPDMALVQGDTTTTMVGAIAAYHSAVKVAHVEAGLRSGRKDSPFPEEINRKLVGHIADFHFAPTDAARQNLRNEGITDNVWITGNTAIDALHFGLNRLQTGLASASSDIEIVDQSKRMILVTSHRRESFGEPFERIVTAIRTLAKRFPDVQIVFPVHLNPQVRDIVFKRLCDHSNIALLDPVDYPTLIWLMKSCYIVLTDSGGIQEEAPGLGKPVLVMREVTERMEGIEAGTAMLVGSDADKIVSAASTLLTDESAYKKMATAVNPYGDGHSAERIVDLLETHFTPE